jgi:hypothetical protein
VEHHAFFPIFIIPIKATVTRPVITPAAIFNFVAIAVTITVTNCSKLLPNTCCSD